MPYELLTCLLRLPVFLMVAARLAGLIMFQPLLGSMAIPVRIRVLFTLGLAALTTPFIALPSFIGLHLSTLQANQML